MLALTFNLGKSQKDCRTTKISGTNKAIFTTEKIAAFDKIKLKKTIKNNTHSILFNALKTSLPIPSPHRKVIPGALNFNHDSMKLIAPTKPIHIKIAAMAKEYSIS